jgi:transcriptional regulator with XRE-family HTH domain
MRYCVCVTNQPLTSTEVIAARMRHLMARKGWTAQQLVDELDKVGIHWTRLIVANLLVTKPERRRRFVTVDELLALAYVLDVAPIHLLLPIDDAAQSRDDYAVTPEDWGIVNQVREWIRGRVPFGDQDPRVYFSEVPAREWEPPKLTGEQIAWESDLVQRKRTRTPKPAKGGRRG